MSRRELTGTAGRFAETMSVRPMGPARLLANSVGVFRKAVLAVTAHAFQLWGAVRGDSQMGTTKATPIEPKRARTIYVSAARGAALSQVAQAVPQVLLEVIRDEWRQGPVSCRLLGSLAETGDRVS